MKQAAWWCVRCCVAPWGFAPRGPLTEGGSEAVNSMPSMHAVAGRHPPAESIRCFSLLQVSRPMSAFQAACSEPSDDCCSYQKFENRCVKTSQTVLPAPPSSDSGVRSCGSAFGSCRRGFPSPPPATVRVRGAVCLPTGTVPWPSARGGVASPAPPLGRRPSTVSLRCLQRWGWGAPLSRTQPSLDPPPSSRPPHGSRMWSNEAQ